MTESITLSQLVIMTTVTQTSTSTTTATTTMATEKHPSCIQPLQNPGFENPANIEGVFPWNTVIDTGTVALDYYQAVAGDAHSGSYFLEEGAQGATYNQTNRLLTSFVSCSDPTSPYQPSFWMRCNLEYPIVMDFYPDYLER